MNDPADWLRETQGVTIEPRRVADPARAASRIGALARESALSLPFDTDPTGFWRLFVALADERKDG